MSTSIFICNRGRCDRLAIQLIGETGKAGDQTKIGQFGSGTTYAVALAMRLGWKVSISSEDSDGAYTMEPWVGDRSRVYWRVKPGSPLVPTWWHTVTSAFGRARSVATTFTPNLGHRDWSGAYPVVREFVSNAYDEDSENWAICFGQAEVADYYEAARVNGANGVTVVELSGPGLSEILEEWGLEYFRINGGFAPGQDTRPGVVYQGPEGIVWEKFDSKTSPARLFYKGVRVHHSLETNSMFDYTVDVKLTESRTLSQDWEFGYRVVKLLAAATRKYIGDDSDGVEWVEDLMKHLSENQDSFESSLNPEWADFPIKEALAIMGGEGVVVADRTQIHDDDGNEDTEENTEDTPHNPELVVLPVSWAAAARVAGVPSPRRPMEPGDGPITWKERSLKEVALDVIQHAADTLPSSKYTFDELCRLADAVGVARPTEQAIDF